MGKLSARPMSRPSFRTQYRKLVEEYGDGLNLVPSFPEYFSYCCHQCGHQQKLQAEEINTIVGNAFRMAYAAQLQKNPEVIAPTIDQKQTDKILWTEEENEPPIPTMDVDSSPLHHRLTPPTSIPGLKPAHKYNVLGPPSSGGDSNSQLSTPSSEESNSPTDMNTYKRMVEKPPLIKRIAMGLSQQFGKDDSDSCPLVSDNLNPPSPQRPLSGGYVNETAVNEEHRNKCKNADNLLRETVNSNHLTRHIEIDNGKQASSPKAENDFKAKRISQISSSSSSSCPQVTDGLLSAVPPPTPPDRLDSLNNREEGELRAAPWFQAGIPREIALEILAREPPGAFMVRESTSKPGCFALSLRVPRTFQPTGIAHYLIVRGNRGYKIKGFTKEFTTLTSLITHHSVMPELLPCPLSLSRYNPSFVRTDSKRDFADIDLDPDYNTLADFRKMMADLNI